MIFCVIDTYDGDCSIVSEVASVEHAKMQLDNPKAKRSMGRMGLTLDKVSEIDGIWMSRCPRGIVRFVWFVVDQEGE